MTSKSDLGKERGFVHFLSAESGAFIAEISYTSAGKSRFITEISYTSAESHMLITEKNDPSSNVEQAIWSAERQLRGFHIFYVFLVPISSSVY